MLALLAGSAIIATSAQHSSSAAELSRVAFSKFDLKDCSLSASYFLNLGIVPGTAKHRYEINHVSCYLVFGNPTLRPLTWQFYGLRFGVITGRIHLRPSLLGSTSSKVSYNANEEGLVVVPGGGTMVVSVSRDLSKSGGIPELECSVGGYDVRLE